MRTIPDLLTAIERAQAARARHHTSSIEWQSASEQLDLLFQEIRQQTNAAVGSAFSSTLLGVSQRELEVTSALGERMLLELRKRGLTVYPKEDDEASHAKMNLCA